MIQNDRQRKKEGDDEKTRLAENERKADKKDLKHCVIIFRLVHCFKPYTRSRYCTLYML